MAFTEMQAAARKEPSERPIASGLPAATTSPLSAETLKWATRLLVVYFALRLVFLALSIPSFVPPDEVTHAGICKVFSQVFLLPANTPQTYQFGLVTNSPWLYYWIMGKLLHLNFVGLPDLVFLRLLNLPLAFGTLWYAVRLLRLLTKDRLAELLLVAVLTNLAMFTLLSASVSYDNLTNLLAAMAIYYLFAFFRDRSGGLLAASLLCQGAGSLTKVTFLPLILALGVLLLLHEWRNLRVFPSALVAYFRASPLPAGLALLFILVAAGLNLQLYGGNYLRYGTLAPSMSTVVSPAAAMNYRMDARGMIFSQFKEGKISYTDALILAGDIQHPGDKADTFFLLMNYQKMKSNPGLWMGPLSYAWFWFQTMTDTTVGIKAHLGMFKGLRYLLPVYLVLALAALGFAARWRPGTSGWTPPWLAAIAAFYAGYFMYEINYDSYLSYGEPGMTVYGRYLFPVLLPVLVLLCHYLLELFKSRNLRAALALATALLFICYDFPWFLVHATPEWFTWLPQ